MRGQGAVDERQRAVFLVGIAESELHDHLRSHRTCGDNGPCRAYEEYEADLAEAERAVADAARAAIEGHRTVKGGPMALKVTVEDLETGEKDECVVPDDNYLLITSGSAYLDGTQMYQRAHVLTIKGLKNGIPVLDTRPTDRRAELDARAADALDAV